jgi:hypothetical protein
MNVLTKSRVSGIKRWININDIEFYNIDYSKDQEIVFYKKIIEMAITSGIYQLDIEGKVWCDEYPVVVEINGNFAGLIYKSQTVLN